jgi:hypothetical protein
MLKKHAQNTKVGGQCMSMAVDKSKSMLLLRVTMLLLTNRQKAKKLWTIRACHRTLAALSMTPSMSELQEQGIPLDLQHDAALGSAPPLPCSTWSAG